MRINQNISAVNALRNLSVNETAQGKSLEKLSSGFRINRAADDAAGLVISEGLRSQVGGLKVAMRNAQDGISVVQTAEGALTEVQSILQRMRDLNVQAANLGSNSTTSLTAIQDENDALVAELDRIGTTTNFNGVKLLDGNYTAKTFQVGSTVAAAEQISITITGVSSTTLAVNANVLSTSAGQLAAQTAIDAAITTVSGVRGKLGAAQNRFEHTINSLGVAVENLSASEARIRDADMAGEMTSLTRNQIMVQAGTAMLAQANSTSQSVLTLLRG
ncbi:MAG: flagellin [Acidimicrobiales bacterium]